MIHKKIYKANLYGIDESFKLSSRDIKHEIYLNNKEYLTTIYVYKYFNGYKEIITGKYFDAYKKIYISDNELYFKRGKNKIISCSSPIFVMDDLHALNGHNICEASKKEVVKYIKEKEYNVIKTTLDFLDYTCNNYLVDAYKKYKEENKTLKLLKRMK